jgi:FOG: FHA domain
MEISYKRELNRNYMLIQLPSDVEAEWFQIKMLKENNIKGLLKFGISNVDNLQTYYYEISSKQPLSRIFETRGITSKEVKSLILEISATLKRMEEYLLSDKSILLEADYIYVDPSDFKVFLCCIPGFPGDFSDGLRRLLQSLLNKVDYKDKDSVAIIYSLYQESLKENYSIEDLMQIFDLINCSYKEVEVKKEAVAQMIAAESLPSYIEESSGIISWFKNKLVSKREINISQNINYENEVNRRLDVNRTRNNNNVNKRYVKEDTGIRSDYIYEEKWRNKEADKSGKENIETYSQILGNEQHSYGEDKKLKNKKLYELNNSNRQEGETQWIMENVKLENKAFLKPLFSTAQYQLTANIDLDKFPFILGKCMNGVDFNINNPVVSRLHARIEKDELNYKIIDLNSTNGVFINGVQMETNSEEIIENGDRIGIATLEFEFCVYVGM